MMSLWQSHQPLVLASRSASRRAMLEAAGIPIEVCIPDLDERAVEATAGICRPAEAAALLAREKAKAVARLMPQRTVIGADQTLALEDKRFDQPRVRAGASAQLIALAGKIHYLPSAV